MKKWKHKMLRVSNFCKPNKNSNERVRARLSLLRKKYECDHAPTSTCHVSFEILAMMNAREGRFAHLCRDNERVVVRLFLVPEESDGGNTAMASSVIFSNLGVVFSDELIGDVIIDCWFELMTEDPPMATRIVMRPLGRKPEWPSVRKEPDGGKFSWTLPSSEEIVQNSKILTVTGDSSYEILEIDASDDQSVSFGVIDSSTKIDLEGSSIPSSIQRPPPLLLQGNFYSRRKECCTTPPHPNLKELLDALCQPSTLEAAEKVIHLIGADATHRARECVEAAAHQLGLQCLAIRGLAAFGYHQGSTVRIGSLAEQISGLRAAFQLIRSQRVEPCVLHLYDFDFELSPFDDQVRHDQEARLWAEVMQALETDNPRTDQRISRASPVVIVITTCAPLKVGPLLKQLVFPSIILKSPDEEYAKFLWNGDDWQSAFWDNQLLKGRSADTIVRIREQIREVSNQDEKLNSLVDLCHALDTHNRKQTSQSTRVSNVQWDDVGGLAHVRREIMDAIELPLKHPHLFPANQGRSGILLYGPPGTGKTLVAKAVATECGLPFFSVKGPELLGSYVGESEASVRAIFGSAREAAMKNSSVTASILFFDELDSLAPRRGGVGDGGGVMERVASTLFAELDGSGSCPNGRVFVMGATNRPDLLDPSLLRPGRLDRLVYLGVPTDSNERTRVLAAQIRKLNLEGQDPVRMARNVVDQMPPRLTGADLSAIATGALSRAARRLCSQAEEERLELEKMRGKEIDTSEVLEAWDDEQCTPIVQLEDILAVASQVTPSLSEEELQRYEALRRQFSPSSTNMNSPRKNMA